MTATPTTMRGQILLAEELGYCWGVRRALDIIQEAGDPNDPVATIGDVIHNPQVVERLKAHGVETALTIEEAAKAGYRRVAITAHGAGPHMAAEAQKWGVELLDTTCPLVTKVQRLAQKLVKQGYTVVVYGDHFHPEVKGVIGWAATSRIFPGKKIADLPWTAPRGSKDPEAKTPPRKVAIVSQTTKNTDEFMKFVSDVTALVSPEGGEVRICNTICEPTYERQNALKKLAREADLILAIGGKKSSNTARLAEVGNHMGVESHHIEQVADIDPAWLAGKQHVGITAGASTPDDVIQTVIDFLTEQGFAAPQEGLRAYDPQTTPSY